MKIILIAAISSNNVLGKDGKVPWRSKEEVLHFKNTTTGFPVVMGRKTWDSISKPLKNRINIILSRNEYFKPSSPNVIVFNSLKTAIDYCEEKQFDKVFIIGGGIVFNEAINLSNEIILSKMNFETDGDVFFAQIKNEVWKEISNKEFTDFTVHYYIRK